MTPSDHIDELRRALRVCMGALSDVRAQMHAVSAALDQAVAALRLDSRSVSQRPIALHEDELDDDEPSAGDVVMVNGRSET